VILAFLFLMQMSHQDHAMGFSQSVSKHTFRLYPDGGAIEVRSDDAETVGMIRHHLQTIAKQFADGNFATPMDVHDRLPDGAAAMKDLRADIDYTYAEIEKGGRVRITTKNPRALDAIHQFLRFQIREHKTGDTESILRDADHGEHCDHEPTMAGDQSSQL
jgi:TusA-related sulfurtransferase